MKPNQSLKVMLLVATAMSGFVAVAQADEVNVYSYRQPTLVQPLFDGFTKQTGIKVNMIFANKGLIERIYHEDVNSPADVLLTSDIGRLSGAVSKGISQAVQSDALSRDIPSIYRDPEGHWFGLTQRARVIYASRDRVGQDAITYEELAEPKWKGKICMRSGQHVYNIALIASMIKHHGEEKAKAWLEGVRDNLAAKPAGNDRAQVKGVFSGQCDLAIGNTYYMAKMMLNDKQPEQKQWAASVKMLFPNSGDRGTHVNLSGVVLMKHAPHKANGIKLMEYLASGTGQQVYASVNHEYPLKSGVQWSDLVKSWGEFKTDALSLDDIAGLRKRASELVDEVRFNQGPGS